MQRALWSHQIRSVAALLTALDGDLGLYYLHGQGLGTDGLERVHDRVRQLERTARVGDPAPLTLQELRPRTARPRGGACP
ncbi:hypothetical protein [Streptomyces sp. NPDC002566]|uniref:hypothetical protein n=1 Tax=Streptomyces sp. NPDC002566 TaxID=3364650 RepID=UPI00367A9D24